MLVLISNDDGIEAPGLRALEQQFREAGFEVAVSAPAAERSGSSHAVTLREPLRIAEAGPDRYKVFGTPADCVHLAVNELLKPRRPDLVVSGINRGANLGCDIHYSGTVGAAREGCLLNIPSFAISLQTDREDPDFGAAARFGVTFAQLIMAQVLPPRTFMNVNLPDLPAEKIRGIKVTRQGIRIYNSKIRVEEDPDGRAGYLFGGPPAGNVPLPDSDIPAVEDGYISVSPLRLDSTNDCVLEWLTDRIKKLEG